MMHKIKTHNRYVIHDKNTDIFFADEFYFFFTREDSLRCQIITILVTFHDFLVLRKILLETKKNFMKPISVLQQVPPSNFALSSDLYPCLALQNISIYGKTSRTNALVQ